MLLRLRNLIKLSQTVRPIYQSAVRLNDEVASKEISGSNATKFQVFRNQTGIIFDIEEERKRQESNDELEETEVFPSAFAGVNLNRKFANVSSRNVQRKF